MTPRSSWRPPRLSRAALVLGALVLVSTIVRAWASRAVPTPWISPDEMVYGLLGRGLYATGHLAILGGPTPFYSLVVPAIVGLPLSLHDLALGYSLLKVLQALVMSLTAVPVYLWGKTLMRRRWALVAATLTLALPALAYSGLILSDVVFYPVFVLAAWATATVVRSPTRRNNLLFVLAFALAVATRLQAVVLLPVFLSAIGVEAILARSRRRLSQFLPSLAALGVLAAVWIVWHLASSHTVLAGYGDASGSYSIGLALRFILYHAADTVLLVGVLPACALLVLLWLAWRKPEESADVRAYLATAGALAFWLVIEVGVFASREVGLLAERNLFALGPVFFLGLSLWLARGGPGGFWVRSFAALAVAGVLLALPLRFVTEGGLPDSLSIVPLEHLQDHTSTHVLEAALDSAVAVLVLLFALLPRRALIVLPLLLFFGLTAGSVEATHEVTWQAKAQQAELLGPDRRWIDEAAAGPVAYIYDGQTYWEAVWQNVFWNRRIRAVYDLPGASVRGPMTQQPLTVEKTGALLLPDGSPVTIPYLVAPYNYAFDGQIVAPPGQHDTGLNLWQVTAPARLATITAGVEQYGDIDEDAGATLHVYGCKSGKFSLVLLVKEPQTDRIYLDGRLVSKRTFTATQTWYPEIPVSPTPAGSNRICVLAVKPGGLLGSTRFEWQPS